ncbi:MAG TPA: MFS transporter [Gaiellaceae bacterium]|nr:MFS transporter [Gaiellaceae bacterium]
MSGRIALAVLAMATGQTAVYLVRPTTSYRLLGLGHGATAVGLVAAAYALLPLVLAIPLGRRADRRHGARLLLAGCATETVACLLLAVAKSPAALGAASAIVGTGHLALALGAQAVIAREASDERHDEQFALLTAGVSVGQLVGPLLGGLLLEHRSGDGLVAASTRAMVVAAAVAGLATVFAAAAERRRPVEGDGGDAPAPARFTEILGTRGVFAAIFASVAALSATDVFTAYMPVVGEHVGVGPAVVGVLLALRAGASLAARLGIKQLVRRVGRGRLIAVNAVAGAVALAALTLTDQIVVLAALAVVLGIALGFAQPLSMTMVVQLVPEHARASALALRLTGNRLGQAAAPAAAGLVAGRAGAPSVFWLMSCVLAVSAVAARSCENAPARLADDAAGA